MENFRKGRNFWQIKIPNECSWDWRAVLNSRKEASFLARKIIGDDRDTSIWLEPLTVRDVLVC